VAVAGVDGEHAFDVLARLIVGDELDEFVERPAAPQVATRKGNGEVVYVVIAEADIEGQIVYRAWPGGLVACGALRSGGQDSPELDAR
jgi:hypothetical protein